ncbi:hypothetical protein FH972_024383 [Carpinus fangiana]|uniref:Cutinase n=1 Tax=Carpinus fangiana TaxID=176857 RepID=A0A5N6KXW5_9ROSI|nr:hypothetical protein FH972_024383 [Carpinus fangiana]
MKTASSVLIAALAAGASASPIEVAKRDFQCGGPLIVAARGSGEQPGEGVQSQVVGMVKGAVPNWSGSDFGLDYPAVINDGSNYGPSVVAGIQNLNGVVTGFVDQCGEGSKVVLLGYSQGGQVVSSLLGGGSGQPALAAKYTPHSKFHFMLRSNFGLLTKYTVAAAVVFGDPTFIAGQSYDAGSATTNGIIAGQGGTPETLAPYTQVFRSFCTVDDSVCASGSNGQAHADEIKTWAQEATDFIVPRVS